LLCQESNRCEDAAENTVVMPQEDREGSQANAIAPYRLEVHVVRWPDRLAKLRLGFPRAVPSWRETRDVSAKDDLIQTQ